MNKLIKDESGVALVIALLIMVLLTILGTAAIMTSTTDVKISANFQDYQEAFYATDGGTEIGRGIIELSLANAEDTPPDSSVTLIPTGLYTELIGPTFNDPDTVDDATPDASTTLRNQTINMDIDLTNREVCFGSSGVTGGEPTGGGRTGNICSYYNVDSKASYQTASSNVATNYVCRLGDAGCL